MNETKGANLSLTDTKDLVTFLLNSGVSTFEGFGLKLEFRADRAANPFAIEDETERRQAILENFKKAEMRDESDLYWSTGK